MFHLHQNEVVVDCSQEMFDLILSRYASIGIDIRASFDIRLSRAESVPVFEIANETGRRMKIVNLVPKLILVIARDIFLHDQHSKVFIHEQNTGGEYFMVDVTGDSQLFVIGEKLVI